MSFPDEPQAEGTRGPRRARRDAHLRDEHVPLPSVQQAVQERLRAAYTEVLREPVPQRFLDLLDSLDKRPPGDGE